MTPLRRTGQLLLATLATVLAIASLAAIVGVILQGSVEWNIGDTTLLSASHLGRPLFILCLAAALLLRTLSRRHFDRIRNLLGGRGWTLVILMILAAYTGLSGRHALHGDGREYILQTQALVFDRTLRIDPAARRDYWNETNPYDVTLTATPPAAETLTESSQAGGGFGGLYPDRFGDYRYYHFWAYSAVVAPVYGLLHLLDPSGNLEYFAFRIVNVLLLLGFFFLAFRLNPFGPALAALALLLCSPLIPYSEWQHPELFCLFLVFAAFYSSTTRKAGWAAPLLLGLAGSMNLPVLLFFPCLLLVTLTNRALERPPAWGKFAAAYAMGALIGLSALLYFLYYFRTASVISHVGLASLEHASLARATNIFFNPFVGAALFFPMSLLALPACFTRQNRWILCLALISVFGAAWLASATSNLNAGQVGTVRYAVWLVGPLWFCLFRYLPQSFASPRKNYLLYAAIGLSVMTMLYFETYDLFKKDIRGFHGWQRAQPEVTALMRTLSCHGDVEMLVENIQGKELHRPEHFDGVYLWDMGHDHYLWVLSGRALLAQKPLLIQMADDMKLHAKASPRNRVGVQTENSRCSIRLTDIPIRMHHHPVLGDYLLLWTRGKILRILRNQPLTVKSDSVVVADSLDAGMRPE